jgi:hypothetical protein
MDRKMSISRKRKKKVWNGGYNYIALEPPKRCIKGYYCKVLIVRD